MRMPSILSPAQRRTTFPVRRLGRGLSRAIVAGLFALVGGIFASQTESTPADEQVLTVDHISDGDTLAVRYQGETRRLRLIGVDSPESFDDEKAHRDAARSGEKLSKVLRKGERSAAYLRQLVRPGSKVKVEFDVKREDRYGRLLGYAYLPSGEMLNVKLVREGYAKPASSGENQRYSREIRAAFRERTGNGRGQTGR
jgi:micrococcal nuclease